MTAFDQYAIDAFSVNAVDYLLKPVDLDAARTGDRSGRVRRARWPPNRPPGCRWRPADLERVVEAVQARQERRDQLAVRVGERFVLVQADEIVHASLADEVITRGN